MSIMRFQSGIPKKTYRKCDSISTKILMQIINEIIKNIKKCFFDQLKSL